jgi:hypothetical protein
MRILRTVLSNATIATLVGASVLTGVFLASPAQAEVVDPPSSYCGTGLVENLYAGGSYNPLTGSRNGEVAGTVTVVNDDNVLYVTFETTDPWRITEAHVDVENSQAAIPQNKNGNPVPGRFAQSAVFDPPENMVTFAFHFDTAPVAAKRLNLAPHAAVVKVDGGAIVLGSGQTGWAGEDGFPGANWATSFTFSWRACGGGTGLGDLTTTETAFARLASNSTCFLDLAIKNNRWGWTNGPLVASTTPYVMDLYAAAGQCDIDKGVLAGTVTVNYDGTQAVVAYATIGTMLLDQVHVYAGTDPIPAGKNGELTVAPGQYPEGQVFAISRTNYSVTVAGFSGESIYVIAHAVVSGVPVQ